MTASEPLPSPHSRRYPHCHHGARVCQRGLSVHTEYGRLGAVAVDMRERWYGPGDGNASVIDANAYLSFGMAE